jgi:hypothetical protein
MKSAFPGRSKIEASVVNAIGKPTATCRFSAQHPTCARE